MEIRDILRKYRVNGGPGDIVTFAESRYGLKQGLFPVQKFVLKLFYGIPLDRVNKTIRTRDPFSDETTGLYTEYEYLQFLYSQGRCNWKEERIGQECHELVLVMGRRSGKTKMTSVLSCYEYARLLSHENPHAYFRLPQSDMIKIINVAAAKDQAGALFDSVSNLVLESEYLKHFLAKDPLQQEIRFKSEWEIQNRRKNFQGTIRSVVGGATSRTIRGSGAVVVILDELAHFLTNDGKASDAAVYEALVPSLANFKHPNNKPAGKTISLSSPMGRNGKFFDLFDKAFLPENADMDILCVQVPTWDMNPDIPAEFFLDKFRKSPTSFWTEYGAEFADQVNAWITDPEQFRKNVAAPEVWVRQTRGDHRKVYYMGLDFGATRDGTAISICHWEPDGLTGEGAGVLDYHAVYFANRDNDLHPKYRETPGLYHFTGRPIQNPQYLDDVAEEVAMLCKEFPVRKGFLDQYQGLGLFQRLQAKGLRQFELKTFSPDETSGMYANFQELYQNVQLRLYYDELLLWEFETLQAKLERGHRVKVDHPPGGYHNDIADAVVRSFWAMMQDLINKKNAGMAVALGPGQRVNAVFRPDRTDYYGKTEGQYRRESFRKFKEGNFTGQAWQMRRQRPW